MFKIDASLTLTGIVALAAIISPVIVAFMNNQHAYKMKKLEIQSQKQSQAFENYMLSIGSILDDYSTQNFCDYEARKCLAYMYAPKDAWAKMDILDALIQDEKFDDARSMMADVGKSLSKATEQKHKSSPHAHCSKYHD